MLVSPVLCILGMLSGNYEHNVKVERNVSIEVFILDLEVPWKYRYDSC